jgi:lysozyme
MQDARSSIPDRYVEGAAAEFPRWKYAGGKVIRGLERRRAAEREMFEA